MHKIEQEFLQLKKGDGTVDELITGFTDRMRFVTALVPDERAKIRRFVEALPASYRPVVRFASTLDQAFDVARQIEGDLS